jgi:uncharacterized protein YbjT (DUF2867 family)
MVGQGVLRECLLDPEVTSVLSVGRKALGAPACRQAEPEEKFHEIVHNDLMHLAPIEDSLQGYDACFFCLGVTSVGMREEDYSRVTYDLTLAVAQTLAKHNPNMTFIYVSGMGTDSTERGRSMWARVKGKTENALLRLPFKAAYMFRPALIQPLHGIRSKTALYRIFYIPLAPFIPLLTAWLPKYVTTTERVGRAMLAVAKRGFPKPVLESNDINAAGKLKPV